MRFKRFCRECSPPEEVYWDVVINQAGGVDVVPVDHRGTPVLSEEPALLTITRYGGVHLIHHDADELERLGFQFVKAKTSLSGKTRARLRLTTEESS